MSSKNLALLVIIMHCLVFMYGVQVFYENRNTELAEQKFRSPGGFFNACTDSIFIVLM